MKSLLSSAGVHLVAGLAGIGAIAGLGATGTISGAEAFGGITGIVGALLGTTSAAIGASAATNASKPPTP